MIVTEVIDETTVTTTTTTLDAYDAARAVAAAPASRAASVGTEVTNGFVLDVLTIAADTVKESPFSEYYLYGDDNNSWYLITGKHWNDDYDSLTGDVVVHHFYRDTYLPPEHPAHNSLTWFHEIIDDLEIAVIENDSDFLVYSSAPNYPKLGGVVYDQTARNYSLLSVLLPCAVFLVVFQQIARRFG